MKLLLNQELARAGEIARTLREPAGASIRLTGELRPLQGWVDKVWRKSRKR